MADPVGPVNNWLRSLFSQVDVYLNGTLVTSSTNTFPYRAYTETLRSYGDDAKATQLSSQLWHKHTAIRMDSVEIAAANAGFVARRANIVRFRVIDMMGRLHVDLFLQDKFLINGVDVNIRLVRSKNAFAAVRGLWAQRRLQYQHHQRHLVRKEGHPESVRADGAQKALE